MRNKITHAELIRLGLICEGDKYRYYHSHWLQVQRFIDDECIIVINGTQYTFIDDIEHLKEIFKALLRIEL